MQDIIQSLQKELALRANPETKVWFENYLKHSIKYFGVKTPEVKKIFRRWHGDNKLELMTVNEQLELCKRLMLLPHAEEKFAAIIYLQDYLLALLNTRAALDVAEWCFRNECFFDWSTADWFTVRVLANIVKRDSSSLTTITSWRRAESLWQRRASVVALRAVAAQEEHIPLIERTIADLVADSERFIQTGIGWTLSDLSKKFPVQAEKIVERHFHQLISEVIARHTRRLPEHEQYKKRKRERNQ